MEDYVSGMEEGAGNLRTGIPRAYRQCVGIAGDFRPLRLHEKRPAYWLADRRTHWQEDLVLRLAQAFEQATDCHRQSAELDVT